MCGELLKQAERYASEGLHPRVLVDGLDIARDATLEFLETFKVPCTQLLLSSNTEMLSSMAFTSLNTKLDRDLAKQMTRAIVQAIQCIATNTPEEPLDLNRIEIMSMQRKLTTDSRFINGIVLDHGGRHPDMPTTLKNCHVMTCNVTFEYEKTEVQSGFFYSNAQEREKLVESERKWLDERCKLVIDFKRNVCHEGEVRAWSSLRILYDTT
jgi:T-complex protein 1 subunit zeta